MTKSTDESTYGTLERQGGVNILRYRRHLPHAAKGLARHDRAGAAGRLVPYDH
jgi:hypothetical protein